jgi:DNA-binding NarL/FixJ family response regulator
VKIRIVVADDHAMVVEGIASLCEQQPDIDVIARCRSGRQALEAVRSLRPDVVVVDLKMADGDGMSVLEGLRAEGLPTRSVLLTGETSELRIADAMEAGASAVIFKEMAAAELISCIRAVARGGEWRSASSPRPEATSRTSALTPRELEIVRLVVSGLRNREISERLGITEGTVKVHLHGAYVKLGVSSRLQLLRVARDLGLE